MAVLHRTSVRVSLDNLDNFHPRAFEFIAVTIHVNSLVFLLVTINRASKCSIPAFCLELATLLERCAVSNSRLLLVGDFNIHVETPTESNGRQLACILDSFGLKQHVSDPTRGNRILDLVISPRDSDFVRKILVTGPIGKSDHLVVLTSIRGLKPKLPIKTVCFRPWKWCVNMKAFVCFLTNTLYTLSEFRRYDNKRYVFTMYEY